MKASRQWHLAWSGCQERASVADAEKLREMESEREQRSMSHRALLAIVKALASNLRETGAQQLDLEQKSDILILILYLKRNHSLPSEEQSLEGQGQRPGGLLGRC